MGRPKLELIIGKTYQYLKVLKYIGMNESAEHAMWYCQCVCGNFVEAVGSSLKSGMTESCGCIKLERITNLNKKYNQYEFDYKNNIGYCYPEETRDVYFIFDIKDYDLLKKTYWCSHDEYWRTRIDEEISIYAHRFIMYNGNIIESKNDQQIDHKNRNKSDNRRENLRFCSNKENVRNKSLQSNNTCGIIGVNKRYENGWRAYITDNRKQISLGVYKTFEEAVIVRLKAEKELFKDFAPQRHLFEEYGISND